MNPSKWKHRLKSAVPWWFNFDPYPCQAPCRGFPAIYFWIRIFVHRLDDLTGLKNEQTVRPSGSNPSLEFGSRKTTLGRAFLFHVVPTRRRAPIGKNRGPLNHYGQPKWRFPFLFPFYPHPKGHPQESTHPHVKAGGEERERLFLRWTSTTAARSSSAAGLPLNR